jgi:phosphoglycerol transferase
LPKRIAAFAAHWRVALLVCVTTVLWIAHYDRWTLASWSLPTNYYGDSLEILARIEASAEGDTVPLHPQVISRLGAPFGANWSAYPSSDLLLMWVLGRVAHVVGVFPAANLALLFATLSAALAFYGCARWLRAPWEWAFAGALLFAFTFQTFHRGLAHLFIVFAWTVPLALVSCGIVATSRRVTLTSRSGAFCIVTAALIGIGNPYTLFLYVQLLGWAVLGQWLGPKRRENMVVGLAALAAAVAGFFIVESHVWLFATDTAAGSPIVRNYGGTERYALKPIELFLPPATHRWDALAFIGQRYVRWSDWRTGEAFATYLGLVGIIGLIWLGAVTFRALLRRERVPAVALAAGWVLAFASIGGITNVIAFFTGIAVFRATNRYSIFLSALVMLFIVTRIARWRRRWPTWLSLGAAAAVAAVGLADEMPRPVDGAARQRVAQRVESDRELGRRLEHALPAGSMVFQLPVIGFPEVLPPFQLGDYEHFRPYLAAHSLRFTYGSLKGRCHGQWQRDVAELPVAEMVRQLEEYGFAAIYLNRRGFADRGEKLVRELADAGRTQTITGPSGDQIVVFLHPQQSPVMPVARRLTFGQGWHEAARGNPRWAYGPASLSYFNPREQPLRCRLKLGISGARTRHVSLCVNDETRVDLQVDETRTALVIPVTLQPGMNRIDLDSLEPAVRLGMGRDQLRTFALHEAVVELDGTANTLTSNQD